MYADKVLESFKRPTQGNPFWTLPPVEDVLKLFKVFGGNLKEMVERISDEVADQTQIVFLIDEQLNLPGNEQHKKDWDRYQLSFYRAQIAIGTAAVLSQYAKGSLEKSQQFVKDVGKQIMPGVFAPGIGMGGKEAVTQQVDEAVSKYGSEPEEPNSAV